MIVQKLKARGLRLATLMQETDVAHQIDPTKQSIWLKAHTLEYGLRKLADQKAPTVKIGSRGSVHLDAHSLLGHPDAKDVLPEEDLQELWYEVIHQDAAKLDCIPIIVHLRTNSRSAALSLLPNPSPLARHYLVETEDVLPTHLVGDDLPGVIYTRFRHPWRGVAAARLIYLVNYVSLRDRDLRFIERFYDLSFRPRRKVYRVPKDREEMARSVKVLEQLAMTQSVKTLGYRLSASWVRAVTGSKGDATPMGVCI